MEIIFKKVRVGVLTYSPLCDIYITRSKMSFFYMTKIKAALHHFFETLTEDLHPTLAAALADKINKHCKGKLSLTASDIYREYEAWQIAA